MKKNLALKSILVLLAGLAGLVVASNRETVRSANLTSVSLTLSNSRPSFHGALTTGNTVGSSQAIINTTQAAWPSTTSAQLVEGDVLLIGEAASLGTYTVTSVTSASTINITPVLATGDTESGDDVIATSSASLTVRLTTANAITDGSFRILLPAETDNTAAADGIPDGGYFDYTTSTPTVTCPDNISGYTFSAGTSAASSVTIAGVDYNAYICAYTGAGAIGTVFDGTTNDAITVSSVINPAPKKASHATGYADTYRPIVQHLNSGGTVIDYTTISIGVVEAVRVTAEVAPQITFRIIGVNSGTTTCGVSTTVTTTPASVPLAELLIDTFTNAAHALSVSTNAVNGYAVTAVANDQMGKGGVACAGANGSGLANCIPDSPGDTTTMGPSTSDGWASTTIKGFAYSLDDANSTVTEAFSYGGAGFSARQFADAAASESPQSIFTDNTVADNDNLYICYRSIISATQAAGNYENYVTYTATATF